jgi:hypothetical protein
MCIEPYVVYPGDSGPNLPHPSHSWRFLRGHEERRKQQGDEGNAGRGEERGVVDRRVAARTRASLSPALASAAAKPPQVMVAITASPSALPAPWLVLITSAPMPASASASVRAGSATAAVQASWSRSASRGPSVRQPSSQV